ncbi:MAG: alanine/ornithine racemase family PLP-dependent enzyme [Lachnospiraceae bacterium]|nr:alanine/ornithine racemase family PLP-dependent enzyme [Lachnospiraceae bacterium]
MYPCLNVNIEHLKENVKLVQKLCEAHSIQITGITKCVCGSEVIAQAFVEAGIHMLGDARIANLKKLKNISAEKWLIRPPMPCEVSETVLWADVSVNSEIEVIRALNQAARTAGKYHKVILMADLGDIREGFTDYQELLQAAKETEELPFVELYGIGTNLTCFSFIQPDAEKMKKLEEIGNEIEQMLHRKLNIVSGGNSASLDLMLHGGIPSGVNALRLGESLLFGRERANYTYLPGSRQDVFTLDCQIIELKEKPSVPWGKVGKDSYGNKPSFVDRGEKRLKAICALGRQDFDIETTKPVDPGIILLGASSDHLMLDVTDSKNRYALGDIVTLQLGYFSTMRAYTSSYVEKRIVGGDGYCSLHD